MKLADVVYRMSWYRENLTPSRPHLTEDECRERKRKLSEIGFVWGRLQSKWDLVVEGLGAYKIWKGEVDYIGGGDVGVGVGVGAGVGAGAGVVVEIVVGDFCWGCSGDSCWGCFLLLGS